MGRLSPSRTGSPRETDGSLSPKRVLGYYSREVAIASSGRTQVVDVFPANPPDDCSLDDSRNLPDELAASR